MAGWIAPRLSLDDLSVGAFVRNDLWSRALTSGPSLQCHADSLTAMRVHELARELALSSRELIDRLRADGEWVTSHLSVVPHPIAVRYLSSRPPRVAKPTPLTPVADRELRAQGHARAAASPVARALPRIPRRPGPRQRRYRRVDYDDYSPFDDRYLPDRLTTRDIAEAFGVTLGAVRQWVARGYLSPVGKWGTSSVFRTSDAVDAYDKVRARRRATAQDRRQVRWHVERRPIDVVPAKHWDAVVTIDEAARLINVSPATIRAWIHRRHLIPLASSTRRAVQLRVGDVIRTAHNRRIPQPQPWRPPRREPRRTS
jgi:hypothetical protein